MTGALRPELMDWLQAPFRRPGRVLILTAAGVALGGAIAAYELLRTPTLPQAAMAQVGEREVSRGDWARAVQAIASDRREPAGPAEGDLALRRLIDEEVLVQEAVARDLVRSDPRLRTALTAQVLALAAGQRNEGGAPEAIKAELEALRREADIRTRE